MSSRNDYGESVLLFLSTIPPESLTSQTSREMREETHDRSDEHVGSGERRYWDGDMNSEVPRGGENGIGSRLCLPRFNPPTRNSSSHQTLGNPVIGESGKSGKDGKSGRSKKPCFYQVAWSTPYCSDRLYSKGSEARIRLSCSDTDRDSTTTSHLLPPRVEKRSIHVEAGIVAVRSRKIQTHEEVVIDALARKQSLPRFSP